MRRLILSLRPRYDRRVNIEEEWDLTPEQEAELEESIAEADRGEVIPAEEVLREMREILYRRRRS